MEKHYFFVINDQRVGPLSESAVTAQIKEGKITAATLAWTQGIESWVPAGKLPDLPDSIAQLFAQQPPPLPVVGQTPPPLPSKIVAASATVPQGLSTLNERAYKLVMSYYRPFFGRSNFVRDYVMKHPDKSVQVLAVTAAFLVLLFVGIVALNSSPSGQGVQQQQQMEQMQQGADVDWRAFNRAQQSAHAVSMDAIQDVYEYRRDSGDRRDEAYRRANYDWYRDDD
jgi:hypothetical protein